MYSVGVIAVELFQPFGTEMERVQTLGDLRKGKVSEDLCKNWPVLTEQIKLLTSLEPSLRPSASNLLKSDLFSNKDMVCVPTMAFKFCIYRTLQFASGYNLTWLSIKKIVLISRYVLDLLLSHH